MIDGVVAAFMLLGCTFLLLASIGVWRMPDLFMRMSASAKASTLGIGCLLVALMLHFRDGSVTTRSILILFFYFLVSPVAAHMIARAAYIVGVPLWEESIVNEARHLYPGRADRPETGTVGEPEGDESTEPEVRV